MNKNIEIIGLTIRVGDNEVTVTPEEYRALLRAADELLPPEPEPSIQDYLRKMSKDMEKNLSRTEYIRLADDMRVTCTKP